MNLIPRPASLALIGIIISAPVSYGLTRQAGSGPYLLSDPTTWFVTPAIVAAFVLILRMLTRDADAEPPAVGWWAVCLIPFALVGMNALILSQSVASARPDGAQQWAYLDSLKYEECPTEGRRKWLTSLLRKPCDPSNRDTTVLFHFADSQVAQSPSNGSATTAKCVLVQRKSDWLGLQWLQVDRAIDLESQADQFGSIKSLTKAQCVNGTLGKD
jgi:hypothetical protein